MQNRLAEFNKLKSSDAGVETPDEVAIEMAPNEMGKQMGEYYEEVQVIQNLLSGINTGLEKLTKAYSKSLSTTTSQNQETFRASIKQLMKDTGNKAQEVKKLLSIMSQTTTEMRKKEGESAVVRIREQQHANLSRKFLNYMKTYQGMQEEYQEGFKTRMKRTIRIVNEKVTEEEVEELMSKPEIAPQDLFQADLKLTENQKHTLDATYAEVADTHKDILELERGLNEIHQLFVDFATILAEQEDMIDSIAYNVMKANDYVDKGIDNVKDSKKYQRRSRKVYCLIITLIVLLLIGIGIACAVIFGTLGGLKVFK